MITKEEIRAEVTQEALAWVEQEVERRWAQILSDRLLQNEEFLGNNLDEFLKAAKADANAWRLKSKHSLPFEFRSSQELARGSYTFFVRNVAFIGALVRNVAICPDGKYLYRCEWGYWIETDLAA